jgi:hypothetical protein
MATRPRVRIQNPPDRRECFLERLPPRFLRHRLPFRGRRHDGSPIILKRLVSQFMTSLQEFFTGSIFMAR